MVGRARVQLFWASADLLVFWASVEPGPRVSGCRALKVPELVSAC